MAVDAARLRRKLDAMNPAHAGPAWDKLQAAIAASVQRRAQRAQRLPAPVFPPELPITQARNAIAEAIAAHQVVVICGDTGSGKSTQLQKICLGLGRGAAGFIGHTQPRRIAARSVAARIAAELNQPLGQAVGYQVRFTTRFDADGYIKVMTDGILLAETQHDPELRQYDTLIIDEAHERSLNIDFLLGYLKRLLPRRPDLKLLITSATIDPERFARHFDGAPIVSVEGRAYPVEVRYRPPHGADDDEEEQDRHTVLIAAIEDLRRAGPGDILVFLATEREIHDAVAEIRKRVPDMEPLALYARLSSAEQDRVFAPHGRRRVVLATNIAETSLTVPGICYVIDAGSARISRYSLRTKVQRLPIEKVSQASCRQRTGRAGRTAPGICIRLYDEEDYQARAPYTDPEILRTYLAAVILRMADLGLGDVGAFPFVEAPELRAVNDGYKLLYELGAVDERRALTPLGRRMARLPLDPRLARMVLAGAEYGALDEVLTLASALAVPDPRVRPIDKQQAADEKHKAWQDPRSDFLAFLNLWEAYGLAQDTLSRARLKAWCHAHYLSYVHLAEWRAVRTELALSARDLDLARNTAAVDYAALHRALLTGLLGYVAYKTGPGEYTGARGVKLALHPGSALTRARPSWILCAEQVETGRLYARTAARIEPEWVEAAAAHLVKRSHYEPHWERRAGRVQAYERVTLYGLILAAGRKVDYGRIDPKEARTLFIRDGLAAGDIDCRLPFFSHNQALLAEIGDIEARARRRDVVVEEGALIEFYQHYLPPEVCDLHSLERWYRNEVRHQPAALKLTRADLMRHEDHGVTAEAHPDMLLIGSTHYPLGYHFEPGHPQDGVTLTVPVAALNGLDAERLSWLVPGLLASKVEALIRALPKPLRRHFVPVPDYTRAFLAVTTPGTGSLHAALSAFLERVSGVPIAPNLPADDVLPAHLRMHIRVLDEAGQLLAEGRDLHALQAAHSARAQARFRDGARGGYPRRGLTSWDFGNVPLQVETEVDGIKLTAYPTLIDRGESVDLVLSDTEPAARAAWHTGLLRLYKLALKPTLKYLTRHLADFQRLCLLYSQLPPSPWREKQDDTTASCEALRDELLSRVITQLFLQDAMTTRSQEAFKARLATGEKQVVACANTLAASTHDVLTAHHALGAALNKRRTAATADIREQLEHLVYRGFITDTSAEWWPHLPRYLSACQRRLDKQMQQPDRDRTLEAQITPLWRACRIKLRAAGRAASPELVRYRWMLEEYRVSLFSQELKTVIAISPKRLAEVWNKV